MKYLRDEGEIPWQIQALMMPRLLRETGSDATRSVHVGAALFSEPVEYHPLLARHPQCVQGRKQRKSRPAGSPVLQQQNLR